MNVLSPERWQQIKPLLDRLFELPAEEHSAFLEQACQDDPTLHQQLLTLLRANDDSGLYLNPFDSQHLVALLHQIMPAELYKARQSTPAPSLVGQSIGPYAIMDELGRGGMGEVFLAERADGAFDQQVALKLIRSGYGSREVHRRFLAERQILARLRHPNIARLLDGGMLEAGQPYFVMEYIDGAPITHYCDAHQLGVEQRLRLFQGVCRAVQYAHSNLVVHRDLKPGNILVTAEGQVKLLDFGIAKLLSEQEAPETALTRTGWRVMTPEYAAPEQVRGEAVTTATDVYALGVLLYELLTGHHPHRLSGRGQVEWERMICEVEPEAPSTAVGRSEERCHHDGTMQTITPALISQARSTQAQRLRRRLHGDLDTIVLKALRKEPERRYTSAEALLEDIKRHLAGLPVSAQRDTLGYRARKFVNRHRVGVAVAVLFVALLATVAIVTTVQARRIAQEASKSDQVKEFVVRLFEVSDPDNLEDREITTQELLDRGVERIEELENQPEVQAEMLNVLGVVYRQMGYFDQGQPLLERSLTLRRELYGNEHRDVAQSLYDLGWLLDELAAYDEAEKLYREALSIQRSLLGSQHEDVAASLNNLALVLINKGVYDEAEVLLREALTMQQALLGQEHEDVAGTLTSLATLQYTKGDYEETEQLQRQALAIYRKTLGEEHTYVATSLNNLAWVVQVMGDYEEAEQLQRQALAMRRKLLGEEHPHVAMSLNNLAALLFRIGEYDEAERLFKDVLVLRRKLLGEEHPQVAMTMNNLATLFHAKGNFEEAEQFHREALDLYRRMLGEDHLDVVRSYSNLAVVLNDKGDHEEAELLFQKALTIARKLLGNDHPLVAKCLHGLSQVYLKRDRPEEAESLLREALSIRQKQYGKAHRNTANTATWLGVALTALSRYGEAEPLLLDSYAFYKNETDPKRTQKTLEALVDLYTAWGKPQQAAAYQDSLALLPSP